MKSLFSFDGRIGPREFWIGFGVFIILTVVNGVIYFKFRGLYGGSINTQFIFARFMVGFLSGIPAYYILFAVSVKRLHDLGRPGCWSFMIVVPLGIVIVPLWLGSAKGVEGPNEYGPDPRCQ